MLLSGVVLRGLSKDYGVGVGAVSGVDLDVQRGELFVLIGPSGSGKSTLLRLIAGLESPTAGEVWIGGRRVDPLPPRERDVAMVFQNPALFPHLSVFENLAFGLRARGVPGAEIDERVKRTAVQLRLDGLLDRRPETLSGGERQRVALGRAIARRPAVSLFDEPFSSLDAPLRVALRAELTRLHGELGATMIHVTHDQAEGLALGQRIAVMDRGRIVQVGVPRDVYDRPATRFVAEFLGSPPMNVLPCAVERAGDSVRVTVIDGPRQASWTSEGRFPWSDGPTRVDLGVRPEQLSVGPEASSSASITIAMEVRRLEPQGHETIAELSLGPHRIFARLPAHTRVAIGDRPHVGFDPSALVAFDPTTGVALR
ncbi:MAG: ABC transporter ATP-binding protein [Isosphaeraceae bacterium]|nr:ABC transporter ATP-binding protein [Isosphaeraceae bacterium]